MSAVERSTLLDQLDVVDELVEGVALARQEAIRTEDPAACDEADRLTDERDGVICDVVTEWELLGRPEHLRERILALPGAERWLIEAHADPESTEAFVQLVEDDHDVDQGHHPLDDDAVIPSAWDDASVAEALADHLRGRWLYVAAWGRWLRWDGRRWAHDDAEQVHEAARLWVLDLGTLLFRDGASQDDIRRCAGYRNRTRLEAIVTMARRIEGIAETADVFDADPDLLCVANGVVDLRTGQLSEHDPELRITKLAEVDFRPGASHRDVDALLAVVTDDVRPWLQRLIGYAATGHTSEDIVPVWDGPGSNGKSTLVEGVGAVLGDYAGPVSPQLIMRGSHDPHPTIKADLMGKRLVWVSETEEGGAFRMEQVKALTGGDRISARYMRCDFFSFVPTHTLVIATNHRPAVNSTEHAAWRRLRLVPFPFTYRSEHEAGPGDRVIDRGLRDRLKRGKAQREALLAWIIEGAVEWHRTGLGHCAEVDAATRSWRAAEDVILRFIEDRLDLGVDATTRGRDLYQAYVDWCAAEGRKPKSNKNFAAEFMAHDTVKNADVERTFPQRVAHYHRVSVRSGEGCSV